MTTTFGVYSPFLGGSRDMGEVLLGIQDIAEQAGAQVIVIPGPPSLLAGSRIAHDHISGWVVVHEADGIAELIDSGKPLVIVNGDAPGASCPLVLPDNVGGAQAAVDHLLAHGHTRIAFTGNMRHRDVRDRLEGYRIAHAQRGVPIDPALLIDLGADDELLLRATVAGWAHDGLPCTAAFTVNDHNALLIADLLEQAGIDVATSLALAGFDDLDRGQYVANRLTTVRQEFRENGRVAGRLLLDAIAGRAPEPIAHLVPTALIIRTSCGCDQGVDLSGDMPGSTGDLVAAIQRAIQPALGADPAGDHADLWEGVELIAASADAAARGGPAPTRTAQVAAWRAVVAQTTDLGVLHQVADLAEEYAHAHTSALPGAATRARAWVRRARLDLASAHHHTQSETAAQVAHAARVTYHVSVSMLTLEDPTAAQDLAWLAGTAEQSGCLALWEPDGALRIAGAYTADGGRQATGQMIAPSAFPPAMIADAQGGAPRLLTKLLPIRSQKRDWGVLALYGQAEQRMYSDTIAVLLASTLERADLIRSLERQEAEVRLAYEREHALVGTIRELGSPIIPLRRGVLLVPLIGAIDTQRAMQVTDSVLHAIGHARAQQVLLDITGVPLVDTQVANALIGLTRAAMLLGAKVALVGIRPEIAQSIITLGIDLKLIRSFPTLEAALVALNRA